MLVSSLLKSVQLTSFSSQQLRAFLTERFLLSILRAMSKGTRAKIGLGVVTTGDRQDLLLSSLASVAEHVGDRLDWFGVQVDSEHRGVAWTKNQLLQAMLDRGITYLFLMEDDIEIIDPRVLAMYIAAYRLTGIPHLNFSQHGPNKTAEYVADLYPSVEGWPNACGAFSFYTRSCLEEHGLMDENFINAYEHVESSWRIYKGKLAYGIWPDVKGSGGLLRELEDANQKPMTPERIEQINKAREYWFAKDPECPLPAGII